MKKVLSLLLVLVLALGMSSVAFAADTDIGGFSTSGRTDFINPTGARWEGYNGATTYSAGDKFVFKFSNTDFVAKDGTDPFVSNYATGTSGNTTPNDISRGKVTIRAKIKSGSAAIAGYGIETKDRRAQAYLELADPFANTSSDGVDFEITLYALFGGSKDAASEVTFVGTVTNDEQLIYADDEYADISDGSYLKFEEYNKRLEVYVGEGLHFFVKGFKGSKMFCKATDDTTAAMDNVIDNYNLDGVIALTQKGFSNAVVEGFFEDQPHDVRVYTTDATANAVAIPGDALFDVEGGLRYLCRGDENVPYASVYYFADRDLDIDEIDDGDEPDDIDDGDDVPDAPEPIPELGGDDDTPDNINDNPGTGF